MSTPRRDGSSVLDVVTHMAIGLALLALTPAAAASDQNQDPNLGRQVERPRRHIEDEPRIREKYLAQVGQREGRNPENQCVNDLQLGEEDGKLWCRRDSPHKHG